MELIFFILNNKQVHKEVGFGIVITVNIETKYRIMGYRVTWEAGTT